MKDLEVKIQRHSLKLLVYLLSIIGVDLVLGAAWLATVGLYISDYSSLNLKFYLNNQFITLHGEWSQLPSPTEFTDLKWIHNIHAIVELFILQTIRPELPPEHYLSLSSNMEPTLAGLLHTYRDVFSLPLGLPLLGPTIIPFTCFTVLTMLRFSLISTPIVRNYKYKPWCTTCCKKGLLCLAPLHFFPHRLGQEEGRHIVFFYRLSSLKCYYSEG